jgi:uncharacterized protein (TIGR03435 family)
MILRRLVFIGFLAFSAAAQTPASPTPAFLATDIHAAPRRSYPFFFAVLLPHERFVARDATLLDLITNAYDIDRETIQGGPSWLELDRFDLFAKVPAGTTAALRKMMLRDLLAQRFHLVVHNGTAPMPAYVLTVGKDKPKLKPSGETGEAGCEPKPSSGGGPQYIELTCKNFTMDTFAAQLHQMAGGYLDKPVVNSTGLDGSWDFDLKWSGRGQLESQGADGISIFDAVDKQLGLKLTLDTSPRPVLIVDSASREPTPNATDLAKIMPPEPVPQFEVATIKPAKPGDHGNGRISGGEVNFNSIPMRALVDLAWDLNENDHENIVNAPKWLDDDKYDIHAKAANDNAGRPASGSLAMDIYEVQDMLRQLIIERFQIKAHMETRPIDSYTLVAASPKLKAADPATRTVCKEGPGPDGKDPRMAYPALNRLVSCRNMTLAEMCVELQNLAGGYIFNPVQDNTGLTGGYDFTLSFSSTDRLPHDTSSAPTTEASAPNGALSIFDAVKNQLGLRLEKTKRPLPILVIDHIEEKPTEN